MDYLKIIEQVEKGAGTPDLPDWAQGWRGLAGLTRGIESNEDPRYEKVMRWLDVATAAELMGDWAGFCEARDELKNIMRGKDRL